MEHYRYMTLAQEKTLYDKDLWDSCDEMVRGYDITDAYAWEFFWEMFEGFVS